MWSPAERVEASHIRALMVEPLPPTLAIEPPPTRPQRVAEAEAPCRSRRGRRSTRGWGSPLPSPLPSLSIGLLWLLGGDPPEPAAAVGAAEEPERSCGVELVEGVPEGAVRGSGLGSRAYLKGYGWGLGVGGWGLGYGAGANGGGGLGGVMNAPRLRVPSRALRRHAYTHRPPQNRLRDEQPSRRSWRRRRWHRRCRLHQSPSSTPQPPPPYV